MVDAGKAMETVLGAIIIVATVAIGFPLAVSYLIGVNQTQLGATVSPLYTSLGALVVGLAGIYLIVNFIMAGIKKK